MIAALLTAAALVLWPQVRARAIERSARPLISGLAGRDAGARCPRYLTSVFGTVGSVSLDAQGRIADRTELTGPVCNGLKHLLSGDGRRALDCLVSPVALCSDEDLQAVVALIVVSHESMHLRGVLDEAAAECQAVLASGRAAQLSGLTPQHGRVIAWLHLNAVNPYTPAEYAVRPDACPGAAGFALDPPGPPQTLAALRDATSRVWTTLGE